MLTVTSAKRIIPLLISLNVVTILTAVTIFSSGMHIANASNTPNCSFRSSQLVNLTLDGKYSGQLDNDAGKELDSFKVTFNSGLNGAITPANFSAAKVVSTSKQVKTNQGGGIGMTLGGGPTNDSNAIEQKSIFTIDTTDQSDGNGSEVEIQFQVVSGSSQSAKGTWAVINTGSKYDKFAGLFTLTKSGS